MQDQAMEFLNEVDRNEELYGKFNALQDQMREQTVELAKRYGFEVTHEELGKAVTEKHGIKFPEPGDDGADPMTCAIPLSEAPGR